MVKNVLVELGLTEPEIDVYLATLELGPNPASVIAKKAGLKRGHTYNILELLIKKGIATQIVQNKIKYFSICDPRNLLSILKNKKREISETEEKLKIILPELNSIKNPFSKQATVRFFEGIEGIKEVYEDTLREKKDIYAFSDFDYIFPESENKKLYDWIWSYAERRAKKKITYIGISTSSGKTNLAYKKRKSQRRKLKALPKNTYLPVEINIYGDKIAIMSTYKDMVGLIIEDKNIAETLRNLHKAFWGKLKDYKL